jgi:lipoyl(octanoyl) transferase
LRLRVEQLGCVPYGDGLVIQRERAALRRSGEIPDTLLLLEHPPVITIGRGADRANLTSSAAELDALGIAVVESDRGGDVTYHGPGQLVGYPILDLKAPPHQPDLHRYLRQLEEALIGALGDFGIVAGRFRGLTGVWTGVEGARPTKIAAIGIRVAHWVTQHGFALNVCPEMAHFDTIVPCGIRDYGVTSMSTALGRSVAVTEVVPAVVRSFGEVFGLESEHDPTT